MKRMQADSAGSVSVVIPLFNERDNIQPLYDQLTAALAGRPYELIFVDDGSTDGSLEQVEAAHGQDPEHVVLIELRRNFGQTAAIAAGIDHAGGDIIVLIDADLQNDPADIPALLAKLDDGYDLVSGWRRDRKDTFLTRVFPSRVANWLISVVTGVRLHDYGCTLKAYRREVLEGFRLYGEMHRFIPAFAGAVGARITELPVQHHPRRHGRTKYGLDRTLKVILDLERLQHYSVCLTLCLLRMISGSHAASALIKDSAAKGTCAKCPHHTIVGLVGVFPCSRIV